MGVFVRDGRLRPVWRVTFYLLVYLLGMILAQSVVLIGYSILLLQQGQMTMPELTARLMALDLPLQVFTALKAADVLWALLLTWLFGRYIDRRRFAEFGVRLSTGWLDDTILGLALGAIQMGAIVAIEWLANWARVAPLPDPFVALRSRDAVLGLVLFVLVAVGEELIFRGYVQTNLQEGVGAHRPTSAEAGLQSTSDRRSAAVAVGVTAVLFGLFHVLNPNLTLLAMLNLILAGVALGVGYWATGSLLLPMAYHLSWNFVQGSILGLPVSGMRYGGLLIVADQGGLPWLTGGAFGPEGGLLGTLMLLVTVGVFWERGRKTR
jgi:membrane protease YdiL (CAAX protease family)